MVGFEQHKQKLNDMKVSVVCASVDPLDKALEVANENRDVLVGIKVRVGRHASGDSGIAPLDIALQLAEEVSMPLMAHIDEPPPTYDEVLSKLRPGDVLTHCFRPFPNSPVTGQGAVKDSVIEARKRGIRFDIGHGMGSFAFSTARAMLAGGFMPDTISSDLHKLCLEGPAIDQAVTMSKFLCLGVPLEEVIRASTVNAAQVMLRDDLGTLRYRCDNGEFHDASWGTEVVEPPQLGRLRAGARVGLMGIGSGLNCAMAEVVW